MNTQLNKPKGFGEILDYTFQLAKNRFSDFFMIFLILIGPIYFVQAILLYFGGASFFRESYSEGLWVEQFITQLEGTGYIESGSIGLSLGYLLIMLIGLILFPVAQAAVIIIVNHIRKDEQYTVSSVIKQAFSRFWPLIGSSILFGLIIFGITLIPFFILSFISGLMIVLNPVIGIIVALLLFLGVGIGYALLFTKWSFYFGSVTLKDGSPGLGRSWRLTQKRTWILFGLYLIFSLIFMCVSYAVQITATLLLGGSVLQSIIVNFATLITTLFFSVGYAVMYLDLKVRHDADDLKDMIEEYK